MHSQRRAKTSGWLSTSQMLRLASMLIMLAVIGMTISNFRPWAARQPAGPELAVRPEPGAAPEEPVTELVDKAAPAAAPDDSPSLLDPVPGREGDTMDDRNPEERAAFQRDSDVVVDDELLVSKAEIPAYRRLFQWVTAQTVSQLAARDPETATFQQLLQHPDKYRGKLVTLELTVRRVERDPETAANPVGVDHVYQLWGWPTSGRGWLYVIVTPQLPPGFPEGSDVAQTVRVYGYFFKLQGYQPANAKPYARPLVAPLIVGKLAWQPIVRTPNPAEEMLSIVALVVGGFVVLGVVCYWIVAARSRKKRALASATNVVPAAHDAELHAETDEEEYSDQPPRDNFDWLRDN